MSQSGRKLCAAWRANRGLILFIVLMSVFRSGIADWNYIPSGSMRPTIIEGDRVLVNKVAYDIQIPFIHHSLHRHANPERGDIVVFKSRNADKRLIKRVIGVPGDHLLVVENKVILNGKALEYRQEGMDQQAMVISEYDGLSKRRIRPGQQSSRTNRSFEILVPEGHYFMLGDNRSNSADSRFYGLVPRDEIIGRASHVVLSHDPQKYYLPRQTRWFDQLDG